MLVLRLKPSYKFEADRSAFPPKHLTVGKCAFKARGGCVFMSCLESYKNAVLFL